MSETLQLAAGTSSRGSPVHEEVLVERVGPTSYKLLKSPGLVIGVAAGDVIELDEVGKFKILERGRNLCIQIFSHEDLAPVEAMTTERLAPLGGRLDGKTGKLLVYTVPINAGFPAVESALNEVVQRFPMAEWYFGNVYDPVDGKPLNWW